MAMCVISSQISYGVARVSVIAPAIFSFSSSLRSLTRHPSNRT
jgi:hypothetical protein